MSRIEVPIKLKSIEAYIIKKHGRLRQLTDKEVAVVELEADRILRYIKRNWPVDTGRSRSTWTYTINRTPGALSINIANRTYYSSWVTEKGDPTVREAGEKAALFYRLVPEAFRERKTAILNRTKRAIDKTEDELLVAKELASIVPGADRASKVFDLLNPYSGPRFRRRS
jgi:hypothetical protein